MKRILMLLVVMLLLGVNSYAANGDLVVVGTINGKTISATPGANVIPVGDSAGRIAWGAKPAFRGALVYNTTDGAGVKPWSNEEYDTDNIHSTPANASRLTVPAGVSKVRISGMLQINFNATQGYVIINKNGSGFYNGFGMVESNETIVTYPNPRTSVLSVVPGDYFELVAVVAPVVSGYVLGWFAMEIIE